jgi:hypothetical protein
VNKAALNGTLTPVAGMRSLSRNSMVTRHERWRCSWGLKHRIFRPFQLSHNSMHSVMSRYLLLMSDYNILRQTMPKRCSCSIANSKTVASRVLKVAWSFCRAYQVKLCCSGVSWEVPQINLMSQLCPNRLSHHNAFVLQKHLFAVMSQPSSRIDQSIESR